MDHPCYDWVLVDPLQRRPVDRSGSPGSDFSTSTKKRQPAWMEAKYKSDRQSQCVIPNVKKTQKYSQACHLLTFPHKTQEEIYRELNRLGWYWNSQKKEWLRDNTPVKQATQLIRVRVWAATDKVEQASELFLENAEENGLRLIEKSPPYVNRPPNQNDSRIYLTFEDICELANT